MVLNEPYQRLEEELGTDGKEVWYPHETPNRNRRGHHPQELIDCCFKRGIAVVTIEHHYGAQPSPLSEPKAYLEPGKANDRMVKYLGLFRGVIVAGAHAVAWDRQRVYDPRGKTYDIKKLDSEIRVFFACQEIKSKLSLAPVVSVPKKSKRR